MRALCGKRAVSAFSCSNLRTNAEVEGELLDQIAEPDAPGRELLLRATERMHLTARGYIGCFGSRAPSPTSTAPYASPAPTSPRPSPSAASPRIEESGSRRITVSLPEETIRAADVTAVQQGRSRSAVIEDALQWYLRVRSLPIEAPTAQEREALAAGRAQHARGEFVTLDEIRRDLAADLCAPRAKTSAKAST